MPEDKKRVLVVDDNPWIRQLLSDVLEGPRYAVTLAKDGAAAIEELDRATPDLVLLDLIMPGIDGWGVVDHVTKMATPPRVVIVSGVDEIVPPGRMKECIAGSLAKPFDIGRLLSLCEEVLAAPAVIPAGGLRKQARRTFVLETLLLSENDVPLALGQLTQLSPGGFRVQLAIPLVPGDALRISFRVPGRPDPVTLTGRVRWRDDSAMGAEMDPLSESEAALIRELMDPEPDAS